MSTTTSNSDMLAPAARVLLVMVMVARGDDG